MSRAEDTVIIDSGGANLASLVYALERQGTSARLARSPEALESASRAILPGVGAAGDAMSRLTTSGLDEALRRYDRPLLGICLGMQLLFERSAEGDTACLGIIPGRVTPLLPAPGRPVHASPRWTTQPAPATSCIAVVSGTSVGWERSATSPVLTRRPRRPRRGSPLEPSWVRFGPALDGRAT